MTLNLKYQIPDSVDVPFNTPGHTPDPVASPGLFSAQGVGKLSLAVAGAASLASGITGIFSAINAGKEARLQARAARDREDFNVQYAQILEADTIRGVLKVEDAIRERTAQYIGSVRASAAAQGIKSDTGSAGDVQLQARLVAEREVIEARNNAARTVFGFKTQQSAAMARAAYAGLAAENAATQSLLGGVSGLMRSASSSVRDFTKALG